MAFPSNDTTTVHLDQVTDNPALARAELLADVNKLKALLDYLINNPSSALADLGGTPTSRNLTAGNGLTGGGNLTANRTFTMGTPSTVTASTTNSVTTDSHTHAVTGFAPTTRNLTAGNGLTGGGDLSANRTFTLGTPSSITNSSTNSVTATSHTHLVTTATGSASGTLNANTGANVTLNARAFFPMISASITNYHVHCSTAEGGVDQPRFRVANISGVNGESYNILWRYMT